MDGIRIRYRDSYLYYYYLLYRYQYLTQISLGGGLESCYLPDLTWPTLLLQVGRGRRRLVGFSSVRFPVRSQKSKTCNPCLGQPRDSVLLPSFLFFLVGGIRIVLLGDDDSRRCHVSFVVFVGFCQHIPSSWWMAHSYRISKERSLPGMTWVELSWVECVGGWVIKEAFVVARDCMTPRTLLLATSFTNGEEPKKSAFCHQFLVAHR